MTKDEVFEKLKEILIQEFELDPVSVTPAAALAEDLDLDSIDAVDLIVKMKQYTAKKIEPELFKNVRTVQDVADVLFSLADAS
jgi:acyl carrier protein